MVTIAGVLLLSTFLLARSPGPFVSPVSSSSQIYIHGTPVCVTQHGVEIVARVGECGLSGRMPEGDSAERIPFHGRPGMKLPPGHPPIDQDMFPEENRRVLI